MADASDLKSEVLWDVRVRLPKGAPFKIMENELTFEQKLMIPIPEGYLGGCYFEMEKHLDENDNPTNMPFFFKTFEESKKHTIKYHGGWKG